MLPLVDALGVACGVAETGLAPRRPSAAAPAATRDLNRGEPGMLLPPLWWVDVAVCLSCLSAESADPGGRLLAVNPDPESAFALRWI